MSNLVPNRPEKNTLLREWTGPQTKDLVLNPGGFGLGKVPAQTRPDATVDSVCGYCATGCSLKVHLRDGEGVNLSGTSEYPVNLGMACPKGWEALSVLDSSDRATQPLLRGADGQLAPVGWDVAAREFVNRFKAVKETYGGESLAWLGTGQITVEELAYLGALGRFGMGFRHGDGNTRQCMATAVAAYKQSFGFDAPPYTYQDFEESDVLVFVGANPCITHPIMWQRVMRNPHQPQIVVIDPRKTETAMAGTQHYALSPKSDLILFYGIARLLIENGCIDEAFLEGSVTGFAEFKSFVDQFSLGYVSDVSGLTVEDVKLLAKTIGEGKRVSLWWTMGVNQSHEGTRLAQAIINIALLTGNIGRPGTGANSITGQCNAMGSRLFSNTSGLIGGHDFVNAEHRSKVAAELGIDESVIPDSPGYAYDQIVAGIETGEIKGLWIVATNSSHSWIGQDRFKEAIGKLEFLVVQDMYSNTETAIEADLVLPAAGWGEKEGSFINSERRIGRTRKVRRAPGQALSDFNIFRLLAGAWGCGDVFADWDTPENVFKKLGQLTAGRPCDISGIADYAELERAGGIQWPFARQQEDRSQQRRLFADGVFYHADGKAKLIFETPRSVAETTSRDYPFVLLTGRGTSSQWHTQTRTGKSDVLRKLYPESNYVEINPIDAGVLGIAKGDLVEVASERASIRVSAYVTPTVKSGQLFVPMHYQDTNRLTNPSFDPYSRQPSYKHCAVAVRKLP